MMTNRDKREDDWETADGRIIPLEEMTNYHIQNAKAVIKKWAAGEKDPALRGDLVKWRKRFSKEQRRRYVAWIKRKAEHARSRD